MAKLLHMPEKPSNRLPKIEFRITPEQLKTLERLVRETGLTRSGIIKLALSEFAERRLAAKANPRY